MGVRRRLLRDLLSSLKYIKNLSEQQIRASLWRGEGTLYDIEFDPRQIQGLLVEVCPAAFEILSLHVDELYVKIPWSQLGTQSMLIVAKNVNVRFALHCEDEVDWKATIGPMLRRARQNSQQTLAAAAGTLADPAGTFNQLQKRLLHSLQLQANHVRVTVMSEHQRHFSAHRESWTPPAAPEEAIAVEFHDVILTPCDAERVPSDQMKAMAMYEPHERVLTLTRLLKCRSFRVYPPAGASPCASAVDEYMEAPGVLTCGICDRCTSDGPRICPVLLSNELHFDLPSPLRIRCCECQLGAFLAMVSDFAQVEEWRLDETIVGERRKLENTSEVARTFARGPEKKRHSSESLSATLASGLSAGKSSLLSLVTPTSFSWSGSDRKCDIAPGFHPVELPEEEEEEGSEAGSEGKGTFSMSPGPFEAQERAATAESPVISKQVPPGSPVPASLQEPAAAAESPAPAKHAPPASPVPAIPQERAAAAESPATAKQVCVQSPGVADRLYDFLEEEGADEDSDAEDGDFYSIASCSSPRSSSGGERKKSSSKLSAGSTDWLETMRSWFGVKATTQPDVQSQLDLGTQRSRICLDFSALTVQVTVPSSGSTECLEFCGQRTSICLETQYELTEAQRECVRRFAWPSMEDRPTPALSSQLPRRSEAKQRITFPRFTVSFAGRELLRGLEGKHAQPSADSMLVLHMRPRSAPPAMLRSKEEHRGLTAWPSRFVLSDAQVALDAKSAPAVLAVYKRLEPFLVGKVPLPKLVASEGGQSAKDQAAPVKRFPAQCVAIEFSNCEFVEANELGAIERESRWPWRARVPHLMLQSDSNSWDLAEVFEATFRVAEPQRLPASCLSEVGTPDGMVSIPVEMFDELVRRAAESTKKDSQVSAAREELQRAYIKMATSRSSGSASTAVSRGQASTSSGGDDDPHRASDDEQNELDQLRQKCLQLELSLQSQALAQRRLETELAHHQALAQEDLRRLLSRVPRGVG